MSLLVGNISNAILETFNQGPKMLIEGVGGGGYHKISLEMLVVGGYMQNNPPLLCLWMSVMWP
jgi:hypothetical protein